MFHYSTLRKKKLRIHIYQRILSAFDLKSLYIFSESAVECGVPAEMSSVNPLATFTNNVITTKEGETLKVNCSVAYKGAWSPSFRWSLDGQNEEREDVLEHGVLLAESIHTLQATAALDGSHVACSTYFEGPPSDAIRQDSDTHAPSLETSCHLTLQVLCRLYLHQLLSILILTHGIKNVLD